MTKLLYSRNCPSNTQYDRLAVGTHLESVIKSCSKLYISFLKKIWQCRKYLRAIFGNKRLDGVVTDCL